jgi:hypothetical protein
MESRIRKAWGISVDQPKRQAKPRKLVKSPKKPEKRKSNHR